MINASMFLLVFCYFCPKRHQGKLGYFEELEAEGNSHYCYAEQAAYDQVAYCQFKTAEDDPENVDYEGYCASVIAHFLSEGEEGQP